MQISTTINIAAPPERVWAILTDFAKYHEWNPMFQTMVVTDAKGAAKGASAGVGSRLAFSMGKLKFKPVVEEWAVNRVLQWRGKLWGVPGVLVGVHRFELIPQGKNRQGIPSTKLIHSETFAGALKFMMKGQNGENTLKNFETLNKALKMKSEGYAVKLQPLDAPVPAGAKR